jgi:tRNA (guanine37-N1)-methyltransferase
VTRPSAKDSKAAPSPGEPDEQLGEGGASKRRPPRIEVFTIFPTMLEQWCAASLLGKAQRNGAVEILVHDLRSGADDPHRSVDDNPFGGGAGMVLAPGPVFAAVEAARPLRPLYLLSPGGERFDQAMARRLAGCPGFSLLCGRYEGVDQRVADHLVDGELSIGDYVLAGGEAAAVVVIEAVARLLPGVMGNEASSEEESFAEGLLEYPQYTRPASFRGWDVPEILLSGHHGRVREWRRAAAVARTLERRPDLLAKRGGLSPEEEALLAEYGFGQLTWRVHGPDGPR